MDSLSLFQSMQGNVNPIAAYEAGSRLANQMLNVQSQQAQQVFQNLYNSAQQAENRRQFEQTMAFKEREQQDQSARGWFNAETQRMAYDPNRGQTEGPPMSAMQPQVTDLGYGLVSVRTPTERGFKDNIFQTSKSDTQMGLPPAGVIIPGGQPKPMPTASGSGMNSPNPPMDSSLFQDTGTVQTNPDNSLLPGMSVAPQERPVAMPSAPTQPMPTADVITARLSAGMFGDSTQPGRTRARDRASQVRPPAASAINPPRPVVTAAELQPSTAKPSASNKPQDKWPQPGQPPVVTHDGYGGLTKLARGPNDEKTVQYGTINENGDMRWPSQPEAVESESIQLPKVVTVSGITFAQTGPNSWSVHKPDGEKERMADGVLMVSLRDIYDERKEIAKAESLLAEEESLIKTSLMGNDQKNVTAKANAFKAEMGHPPKSPADWDFAAKAYERMLRSERFDDLNRSLEVSREKVERLEGLIKGKAMEPQPLTTQPVPTAPASTAPALSPGRTYLNRIPK